MGAAKLQPGSGQARRRGTFLIPLCLLLTGGSPSAPEAAAVEVGMMNSRTVSKPHSSRDAVPQKSLDAGEVEDGLVEDVVDDDVGPLEVGRTDLKG